jgi:hypothetical protein
MKKAAFLFLLLAAGCATAPAPYAPVRDIAYQARGLRQFWILTIGGDRIVMHDADGEDRIWPRTLPRTEGGRRIWASGEGAGGIRIEARPGPCPTENRALYADFVTVHVGQVELDGCGGRLIRRRD